MCSFVITVAILVGVAAANVPMPHHARHQRDVKDIHFDGEYGKGTIFGVLGHDGSSLFGKAGYKQDIFKDHRGHLSGQAYGSRVLGPNGDSSNFGGRLDYANKNANAALDISRQIGVGTSLQAEGSGVWKIDKNTDLSAGGMVRQEQLGHGRPDVGVQAKYEHRF